MSARSTPHENGGEVPPSIKTSLTAGSPHPSRKEVSESKTATSGDTPWTPTFHDLRTESPEPIKQPASSIYQLQSPPVSASALNQTLRNSQAIPGPPAPGMENFVELTVKDSAMSASQNLDQNTALWEEYNRMADKEDGDFVKAANENLNTLLIFAALFAAINASFIVETFKSLKADPVDKTNALLETMLSLSNSSGSQAPPTTKGFDATIRDIRTNFVFFFSLCASLAGSFLAVMGKQWVSHYELEGSLKPPAERARERQMKFEGRKQYHLQGVMESLSTILQVSLFVFLGGLADFLWPLNKAVAGCVVGFTGLISLTWALLTCIAALVPKFPYQTRLSLVLNRLMFPVDKHGLIPPAGQNLAVNIRAMIQMLEHITLSDTKRLNLLADALEAVPLSTDIKPLADAIVKFCFEPLLITTPISWNQHQAYVIREEFQSPAMMRIVRALFLNPSALVPKVRTAILSHIWLISWQSSMEPATASVIAVLLGDEAKSVENNKWPSPNWAPTHPALQRCDMPLILATHLCGRLMDNTLDAETTSACLKMFYSRLPSNFSSNPPFDALLENLADFLSILPPADPKLNIIADTMSAFFFAPLSLYDQEGPGTGSYATIGTFSTAGDSQTNDPQPTNTSLHFFPSSSSIAIDERYPRTARSYSQSSRPVRAPSKNVPPGFMQVPGMLPSYALSNPSPSQYPPIQYPTTMQLPPQSPYGQQYSGKTPMRNVSLSQPGYQIGMYGRPYATPTPAPSPYVAPTPFSYVPTTYYPMPQYTPHPATAQPSQPPPPPLPYRASSYPIPGVGYVIPSVVELSLPTTSEFQLIDEMLQSIPMLKILLILLRRPSVLAVSARRSILPRIWALSWDPSIEPERAEVICDILVLEAAEVEKMQSHQTLPTAWTTPANRAMALSLASRLSTRIVEGTDDDEARVAYLNMFFQRLPVDYTEDEDFIKLLEDLATFFGAIPPTHPSINDLATSMMKSGFQGRLPALSTGKPILRWPLPDADLDLEEFRSIPILKMLRALFSSPSALEAGARKDIAAHIWARFWSDLADDEADERMVVVADILAIAATEVEAIRSDGGLAWEDMVQPSKFRDGVVILASHLCVRMGKDDWLSAESLESCRNLLRSYFSLQHPDTPGLLKRLIQTMATKETMMTEEEQDRDEGYIACLRFFFTDLMDAQMTDSSNQNYITILRDDLSRQLEYLLPTLNNPNLNKSHGPLGLAFLMALWEHLKADESSAAQFYAPSFVDTVVLLISQEPMKEYWFRTNTSNLTLTHHEGFCMLDRLSSFLIYGLQGFHESQVSLEEVTLLRTHYKAWYRWFQNSKAPGELSLGAMESFSRLNDEMRRILSSTMSPPEQPVKPKLPPSPSRDEGTGDSGPTYLKSALSTTSWSRPEGRSPRGLGRPRNHLPVRFEERSGVGSATSSGSQPVTSQISRPHQHQFRRSGAAGMVTRRSSDLREKGPESIDHADSPDKPLSLSTAVLHLVGSHFALSSPSTRELEGTTEGPLEGEATLELSDPRSEAYTKRALVDREESEQDSISDSHASGPRATTPVYDNETSSLSASLNQNVEDAENISGEPSPPLTGSPKPSGLTLDGTAFFQHAAEDSSQDGSAIRLSEPSTPSDRGPRAMSHEVMLPSTGSAYSLLQDGGTIPDPDDASNSATSILASDSNSDRQDPPSQAL